MRIALTYSSKEGLLREYDNVLSEKGNGSEAPSDFFAEGDSWETIHAIQEALSQFSEEVVGLEADGDVGQELQAYRPDLVFNIAEGLFGDFRESYVPMVCERLRIPYTGSDPLTLAICLNKMRTKEILSYYRIANPQFRMFQAVQTVEAEDLNYPVIIKPVAEGSSKGIFNDSVVFEAAQAKERIAQKLTQYGQAVLVEQFLDGDEFTVAVWGNGEDVEVLPIVAIRYDELPAEAVPIYSYEAKWIWDTPEKPLEIFQCPARIPESLRESIHGLVRHTYHALHIRDWCRVDVRLDRKGIPNILEVNPLPGILPNPEENSCFPKAARSAGYEYVHMLARVVSFASKRWGIRHEAAQKILENRHRIQ